MVKGIAQDVAGDDDRTTDVILGTHRLGVEGDIRRLRTLARAGVIDLAIFVGEVGNARAAHPTGAGVKDAHVREGRTKRGGKRDAGRAILNDAAGAIAAIGSRGSVARDGQ